MNLSSYDIIYLIANTFGTYTIYRFMTVFFGKKSEDNKREFFSYVLYYLLIGAIYLHFNTPVFNLAANLAMFFLITLNYTATTKRRILAVVYIYAILLSVEAVTLILFSVLNINDLSPGIDMELVLSQIFSKILSYVAVLVLSNFKMIKERTNISPLHWVAVFIIPSGTLFLTAIFMLSRENADGVLLFTSIILLFAINIFIFYLYDSLLKSYREKMEKDLLWQHNNAIMKELEIINLSRKNLSILKHDLKLHLSAISVLVEKADKQGALDYIRNNLTSLEASDEVARSGNLEVDSILNYKIHSAKNEGIDVKLKLQIPQKLNIEPFELVAILGNLLDNAVNAASEADGEKYINISISFDRNVLFISVSNPYKGRLVYENDRLKSGSGNFEEHGYGLESIRRSVEKYNGTMKISHENNLFTVDVLVYNTVK